MREVDLTAWPRRRHYELFSRFDHPHFNMCANLEITALQKGARDSWVSFTIAFVYPVARSANAVPEFRLRIRPGKVIEHEVVSPSVTVLVEGDLFSFCTIPFSENYPEFAAQATAMMAHVKEHPTLENEPGRDDLLYMTALPWVSFTSFTHPMQLHPADSIPRFAWGEFYREGQGLKVPLSVRGHHALMDGIHMARFYAEMEIYCKHPEQAGGGLAGHPAIRQRRGSPRAPRRGSGPAQAAGSSTEPAGCAPAGSSPTRRRVMESEQVPVPAGHQQARSAGVRCSRLSGEAARHGSGGSEWKRRRS